MEQQNRIKKQTGTNRIEPPKKGRQKKNGKTKKTRNTKSKMESNKRLTFQLINNNISKPEMKTPSK